MKDRERHIKFLKVVKRLDASYSVGGKEALARMTGIEVFVLYNEKMCDLNAVCKKLHQYPHDELGQVRKTKLEMEIADMAGFMKANFKDGPLKDKGIDLER